MQTLIAPRYLRVTANASTESKKTGRRQELESARKNLLKRIQTDLRKIGTEEKEYSRELLKELVPVRVSFKKGFLDRLKESSPIQIEILKNKNSGVVTPEVVSNAELD